MAVEVELKLLKTMLAAHIVVAMVVVNGPLSALCKAFHKAEDLSRGHPIMPNLRLHHTPAIRTGDKNTSFAFLL